MSNNLDLDQITAGQTQKETTANDQSGQLDAAITDTATYAITSSNARTLTNDEFRRVQFFTIDEDGGDPADSAITVTVPAIKRGTVVVLNDTAYNVTVTISGQSKSAPVIATGNVELICCDSTDVMGLTV